MYKPLLLPHHPIKHNFAMTTAAFPVQFTKKHLILHRFLHESNNDTCSCCKLEKFYAPYKDVPQEPQTGHEVNAASTEERDVRDFTPSSHNSPLNYPEDQPSYAFQHEKSTSHSDEDYEEDEVEEEDDDDYEYVGSGAHHHVTPTVTTHGKKRSTTSSVSSQSRKPSTSQQVLSPQTNANSTEQLECCLLNCHNPCSNRLRFSLKSLDATHFKPDFLDKDWNRICNYCYFHTLYTFKKQMASHQQNSSGDEATTTTTRKRRNSGAKRPRKEVSSMFTALPSISGEYKPSSEDEESSFTKKMRNI